MISRGGIAGIVIVLVAGCGSPAANDGSVASKSGNLAATKLYNAEFHFESPKDCVVHVNQVTTDTNSQVIEFDMTGATSGLPISATYIVVPSDSHPLHLIVSAGTPGNAQTLFSVLLSATDASVEGPTNAVLFDEQGFVTATLAPGATAVAVTDAVLFDALGIAQCSPEMQTTFGILPALENKRNTVVSAAGDVTSNDPDGPTLVPGWPNGEPFGQAFFRATECLGMYGGSLTWVCHSG